MNDATFTDNTIMIAGGQAELSRAVGNLLRGEILSLGVITIEVPNDGSEPIATADRPLLRHRVKPAGRSCFNP